MGITLVTGVCADDVVGYEDENNNNNNNNDDDDVHSLYNPEKKPHIA